MKPLIGVTCNYREKTSESHNNYANAVAAGGGVPVIIPQVDDDGVLEEILGRVRGVLIIGGADVPPRRYRQAPHPKTNPITPEREASDFRLIEELRKRDLPTLAICYGIQALNVAYGGTLWQDIPSELPRALKHHREKDEPRQFHMVNVTPGTLLHRLVGFGRLETNSSHHQSVKDTRDPLRQVAFADDGVVEAVEHTAHRFMVGIQWHPESLTDREVHLKLFRALVAEASK